MKAHHFLRAASVLTLLYAAGHTSGLPWTPYTDASAQAVLESMKGHSFEAQGFRGTYWDIYFGFGLVISLFLFVQAVLLWQVATISKSDARRIRPIIVLYVAAFLVNAALAAKYFFIIPVLISGAIALCLGVALWLGPRESPES